MYRCLWRPTFLLEIKSAKQIEQSWATSLWTSLCIHSLLIYQDFVSTGMVKGNSHGLLWKSMSESVSMWKCLKHRGDMSWFLPKAISWEVAPGSPSGNVMACDDPCASLELTSDSASLSKAMGCSFGFSSCKVNQEPHTRQPRTLPDCPGSLWKMYDDINILIDILHIYRIHIFLDDNICYYVNHVQLETIVCIIYIYIVYICIYCIYIYIYTIYIYIYT